VGQGTLLAGRVAVEEGRVADLSGQRAAAGRARDLELPLVPEVQLDLLDEAESVQRFVGSGGQLAQLDREERHRAGHPRDLEGHGCARARLRLERGARTMSDEQLLLELSRASAVRQSDQ